MTLTVTPEDALQAGGTATISVTGLSGTSVTCTISNGLNLEEEVEITLDDNGDGSATWDVPNSPNWAGASFSVPGCQSLARPITSS